MARRDVPERDRRTPRRLLISGLRMHLKRAVEHRAGDQLAEAPGRRRGLGARPGTPDAPRPDQHLPARQYALIQVEPGAALAGQLGLDQKASSSCAGRRKTRTQRCTAKKAEAARASVPWSKPRAAQHLGPRPLGELQIVGVVDDAAGIGVLVVDPDLECRCGRLRVGGSGPSNSQGCGDASRGGSRPRWRQARRVRRRPRGVRCSRPC